MARSITDKNIKEVTECKCGLNSCEDYIDKIPYRHLLLAGYKKRKYRNTGETFYYIKQNYDSCERCTKD